MSKEFKEKYPYIPYKYSDYEFYDLGTEDTFIRMSNINMANILRAVIRCHATITDTSELEGYYKNQNQNTVCFRLSLPKPYKERFEEMSGFKLTKPEKVVGMNVGKEEERSEIDE